MPHKFSILFFSLILAATALPAGAALARGEDQGTTTANQQFGWGCWNRGDAEHVAWCVVIRGHGSGYR